MKLVRMRVLVVEDEIKMASLIRRGLRSEGLAADVAIKGEDALWMANSTGYDAIVLDVCELLREVAPRDVTLLRVAQHAVVGGRAFHAQAPAADRMTAISADMANDAVALDHRDPARVIAVAGARRQDNLIVRRTHGAGHRSLRRPPTLRTRAGRRT